MGWGRREVEGGRQREEGTPGRENPGSDRDMGAVRGWKRGATGRGKAVTGLRMELLWYVWQGREAQTSGGGRRAGAPSRWTVDPRLGEMGREEEGAKRGRSCVYG